MVQHADNIILLYLICHFYVLYLDIYTKCVYHILWTPCKYWWNNFYSQFWPRW